MYEHIDPIAKLTAEFAKLPGVGEKTALRYAYYVLKSKQEYADELSKAVKEIKSKVKYCKICGCFSETEVCDICTNRDHKIICVVTEPKDIAPIEKLRNFKGVYHVLNGTLDPFHDIGPNELRVKELLERLDESVEEVVIATDVDSAGEVTATYLKNKIKPLGVKVTRLAKGLPEGGSIEYADQGTLSRSFNYRYEI